VRDVRPAAVGWPVVTKLSKSRAAFEAWIKPMGYSIDATATGSGVVYQSLITSVAWRAWLESARQSAADAEVNA
jgi:hypothetical protein